MKISQKIRLLIFITVALSCGVIVAAAIISVNTVNLQAADKNIVQSQKRIAGDAANIAEASEDGPSISDAILYDTGFGAIISPAGEVVASHGIGESAYNSVMVAAGKSLSEGKPVSANVSGVKIRLYADYLPSGEIVFSGVLISELDSITNSTMLFFIVLSLLLSVGALIAAADVARGMTSPLEDLVEASEQIANGNLDVELDYNGDDEVGILTDSFREMVSQLKGYMGKVQELAFTDQMTGLRNKTAYLDKLESIKNCKERYSVVMMDVNNLKKINDSIGHEKGDLMLKHVAEELLKAFHGIPIYRIGGDEFCCILSESRDPESMIKQAQRLVADRSAEDLPLFHVEYQVAAGFARKGRKDTYADVFKKADEAMYENKQHIKGFRSSRDLFPEREGGDRVRII